MMNISRCLTVATAGMLAICLAANARAATVQPASQPSATAPTIGLLPPVIVVFEDRNGKLAPNADRSAAAARAVREVFHAEMAERNSSVVTVTQEDVGPVDHSSLEGLPDLMVRDSIPIHEAMLAPTYAPDRITLMVERHQLDAFWVVSGVQVPSRAEGRSGYRLLLKAALIDRKGPVLYSDMVDDVGGGDLREPETVRRVVRKLLAEYRTEKQRTQAAQAAVTAAEIQAAEPKSPHPPEFRIGLGIVFAAPDGVDLLVSFSPANSHWQIGYRYVRWSEDVEDPYTGRKLTTTTYTMQGPQVNFLFSPEKYSSWYLGMSLLRWTSHEVFVVTGASDSDTVTVPFFGGGYTGRMGSHFFFNLGMFFTTATGPSTNTGYSSGESMGGFDIQLQLGVAF